MLRSLLAGRNGPNRTALPAGEFLHPVPLLALLVLVANDWWLKPSGWAPGVVTGKLSDFAGLLFFPLLLTASTNCLALGLHRAGFGLDFTLRRYKAAAAIMLTALAFTAVKVCAPCNQLAVDGLGALGFSARIVLDATDLVALPVLLVSWRLARREIARVPLGRIELIEAQHKKHGVGVGEQLNDTLAAGASPALVDELSEALGEYLDSGSDEAAKRADHALSRLRDLSLQRS